MKYFFASLFTVLIGMSVQAQQAHAPVNIYETSASGNKLQTLPQTKATKAAVKVVIQQNKKFQTITGFGGSFTHATAHLMNQLSAANRKMIIEAYFSPQGAHYSLTRTHINSCDFSLYHYAYNTTPGDTALQQFDISEDLKGIIPMIKEAQKVSNGGFKVMASPWTAPPWMKDNNDWRGGKLLSQYRNAWALYFSKYIQAYQQQGIPIWGVTVENEPLGNDKNWESMHFTPQEMTDFVKDYLGPKLEKDGWGNVKIFGYDQNRGEELEKWANVMYANAASAKYFDGMAVHWYASTYDYMPASLQHTHKLAPNKHIINTEACVDAEVPKWKDDNWYWSKEATDWGWDWASEKEKYLHPKYVPVFRYAGDIIGCLNNYVDGWIDWNMVLDKQGGPNWFKNWCVAPVIVDPAADEVYFTPLYYTMAHFSKFIRPGAVRIGVQHTDKELMITAAQNPDKSVAIVLFNPGEVAKPINIQLNKKAVNSTIAAKAIQTIILKN